MKLLSSSSTSSSSFHANNVCNSEKPTAGCIVGVIRRLFCTSHLPKYPSDQTTIKISELCENDHTLKEKQSKKEELLTPGLMARLMGLENMPVISNTRSRSMNSADFFKECDEGRHRRTKTSLSFREVPMFLELENDDYFILSFENLGKAKKLRSKEKNCDVGIGELKHRKAKRRKDKENRAENVFEKKKMENQNIKNAVCIVKENPFDLNGDNCKIEDSNNILCPAAMENSCDRENDDDDDSAKVRKKMENEYVVKKVVSEEDSSPVSVFDFEELLFDLVVVSSSGDDSKSNDDKMKIPRNINCVSSILWCEICKLAKEDIMKSNWRCKLTIQEIGADIEVEIFDQLLKEMVNQLVYVK